jgi:hypothetical protein
MANLITTWQNELSILETNKNNLEYQLCALHNARSKLETMTIETWSERVKKSSTKSAIEKKIFQLEKYKTIVNDNISKLREQIDKEKSFQEFLQPFRDAKFIIYDDGEVAYLAQTLQRIKPLNNVLMGGYFVDPDVFSKLRKQLKTHGLKFKDIMPGDYSALNDKYLQLSKAGVMDNLRQLFRSNGHISSCSIHFTGGKILYL